MLKKQKAFTLIELMVTVLILAIVMAIALPNFKTMVANNRSIGAGGDLVAALNLARTEAIKRSMRVTLCTSTDGTSCLSTGDWTKGWLVFLDKATTDTGAPDIDSANILRYWKDLPPNLVATAVKKPSNTAVNFIRFTPLGSMARAGNDTEVRELNISTNQCRGSKQKTKVTLGIAGIVTSSLIDCP